MHPQNRRIAAFRPLAQPNRALAMLALFIGVQIADASLTAMGINRFGVGAEANPLLAFGFILAGPAIALTVAKGAAVMGAVMLYGMSRHALLAQLTVMYVAVAVAPWAWALTVA